MSALMCLKLSRLVLYACCQMTQACTLKLLLDRVLCAEWDALKMCVQGIKIYFKGLKINFKVSETVKEK
jgi:hypothetical protein